jgi:hypothetical protein
MRPIDEMWQAFAFTPLTERTRIEMTQWLTDRYPEATWIIYAGGHGGVTVSPQFNSEEDKTFYLLKWA